MAITEREMKIYAPEAESRKMLSRVPALQILAQLDEGKLDEVKHLFIEVSASQLPLVTKAVKAVSETKHLRALFIREDIDSKLLPQMLQRADLRLLRNILVHGVDDWATPERVMNAWQMGSEDDLIATAATVADRLYVLTCALEKLEIAFTDNKALSKITAEERSNFEIDEAGSFLHWPQPDIHINIEDIRYASNNDWREKCDTKRLTHNKNFGTAIEKLRKKSKLRQNDIEGLTDRQLRRIESGEARPSVATLQALAEAHDLSFNDYLEELGQVVNALGR